MPIKALIVDDSLESRMLLGKILTKAFHAEIIEASHGKEALRKLSAEKPDVIFLDYEMPVLNGKETLKSLRAKADFKDVPVFMITSHSETPLIRELMSYKVTDFLLKPFSSEYVVNHVSILFPKDRASSKQ
ncbi:MAG: response regulator [Ignavibacteriae bacterium]|nr:MAG: response regulator [Ignavibacteriota bacterium]